MHGEVLELAPDDAIAAVRVLREAQKNGRLALDEVELYGSLVHVIAPDMRRRHGGVAGVLRENGIQPGPMSVIEPSLEDVFIHYTGKSIREEEAKKVSLFIGAGVPRKWGR
jgi:ABC-2 type transport system ATP-binding protein